MQLNDDYIKALEDLWEAAEALIPDTKWQRTKEQWAVANALAVLEQFKYDPTPKEEQE